MPTTPAFMPQIKHIVHLMLENRSMDNVLGWLYADGTLPSVWVPAPPPGVTPVFNGLATGDYTNPVAAGGPITNLPVQRSSPSETTPDPDPGETYEHVLSQVFGNASPVGQEPPVGTAPTMAGFAADYHAVSGDMGLTTDFMSAFSTSQLPVLSGLARNFAVSDAWFASVPTQTNCNRAFSLCGTSLGAVDNDDTPTPGTGGSGIYQTFQTDTLFNVLSNLAPTVDWTIYYSKVDLWPPCYTVSLFPNIENITGYASQVQPIDDFFSKAKAGKLGAFSYVEPAWGLMWRGIGTNGNDYHPPCNVQPGEAFLASVYAALTANTDAWNKTLLIITFDEHGGTFDHVAPSWQGCTPPDDITSPKGFGFNRFGVRVPTILVSPWVAAGTVFRSPTAVPFDHTSVIATVMKWAGLDPTSGVLGARVAAAASVDSALTLSAPRTDLPVIQANADAVNLAPHDATMGGLELNLLPLVANHLLRERGLVAPTPAQGAALTRMLRANCRTRGELAAFAASFNLASLPAA